jgi:hypothetical protein
MPYFYAGKLQYTAAELTRKVRERQKENLRTGLKAGYIAALKREQEHAKTTSRR